MTNSLKYSANDALKVIDGPLSDELNIHRFDATTRTKSQLFGVNGPLGKQFGVVLGNTDIHNFRDRNHRLMADRTQAQAPGPDLLKLACCRGFQ
jgi:hypothetical protein